MSRIAELRDAVERGESVDLDRLAALQALDAAVADEQFAAEATARQEAADAELGRRIADPE
jgi:hypothetical protein